MITAQVRKHSVYSDSRRGRPFTERLERRDAAIVSASAFFHVRKWPGDKSPNIWRVIYGDLEIKVVESGRRAGMVLP